MEAITIVTRSFQAGTGKGGKDFDKEYFYQRVAYPIRRLLAFENVASIVVVTSAEKGNVLAEIMSDGSTPTTRAIKESFPDEVKNKRIVADICLDWGPNPGSGNALCQGAKLAKELNPEINWIFNWSPEIEMDGFKIDMALAFARKRNLLVVGFLRDNWWEKPQWHVVQNTAAIWQYNIIEQFGFARECNGTGKTIWTPEHGEVPLAGMEDFHTMLRAMKAMHNKFRWGMVGRERPLLWNTNFLPGSDRERRHLIKVTRQFEVMKAYSKDIFPELTFNEVMNRFFTLYHQD
jgi:hypothetical protein